MSAREFPGGGRIEADEIEGGSHLRVGPGVTVRAQRLVLGDGVQIGTEEDEDAFRFPGGTRITADVLELGAGVRIGRQVLIKGGRIDIGRDSRVGHGSTLKVNRRLVIGAHGIVNEWCEVAGHDIEIGRELWMLPAAKIGGGSAFEVHSSLKAGHWLHLGMRTLVNTARAVVLGDEVGLGTGTCLYTHGAYPSALDGKPAAFGPITIGDRTWVPGAIVNPSVTIGSDCVIGVGSVVTRDVPAGSLAAGIPATVIKEHCYPKPLEGPARLAFVRDFLGVFSQICSDRHRVAYAETADGARVSIDSVQVGYLPTLSTGTIALEGAAAAIILTDDAGSGPANVAPETTVVDLRHKRLTGPASPITERLLNQLRRYGIRFNYEAHEGRYRPWE